MTAQNANEDEIETLGTIIAQCFDYQNHKGRPAIHWYLIERYHWTLEYVRSLSDDDLSFLLQGAKIKVSQ